MTIPRGAHCRSPQLSYEPLGQPPQVFVLGVAILLVRVAGWIHLARFSFFSVLAARHYRFGHVLCLGGLECQQNHEVDQVSHC